MRKSIYLMASIATLAFASCKSTAINTATENTTETTQNMEKKLQGKWVISELSTEFSEGKSLKELFPGKTPFLNFDVAKTSVNGTDGCNNLFGKYTVSNNNQINLTDQLASTLMACFNVNDAAFNNALKSVNNFSIKNDELILSHDTKVVMKLSKESALTLEGIVWEMSYIQPLDRSMKTIEDRFPQGLPNLEISDQSVHGSTGCNRFNGGIILNGDALSFDKLGMTRMFCEGVEENLFTSNLEKVTKYSIENDELILYSKENMVLFRFKKK